MILNEYPSSPESTLDRQGEASLDVDSSEVGIEGELDQEMFGRGRSGNSIEGSMINMHGTMEATTTAPVWGASGTGCFQWGAEVNPNPLLDP
jgi:hypothetical protein